jgi:threonylcarbamoyladenosine tRNA methylthiotransferase MtaB
MEIDHFENHTRAFVKIQDGCNAFCSYCIIPYTRGIPRSKKESDVIKEVTGLVENGYKEIVLTGIHTGRYGTDLEDTNLEQLLRKLVKIPNIYRIRLSSIEINEVTDGILDLMRESNIIASHLHIPIQSGSDRLMNRKYDINYFIKRIEEIRKVRDDISITTDLIVGFPGETQEDFQDTINTLEEIKFTKIHTFPYSKREGTPASKMPDQVNGIIKKKRVSSILELSNKFENSFYKKYINTIQEGVAEVRNNGTVIVHSSNFIPIIIEDNSCKNNEIISLKITKIEDNKVYGIKQKD